MHIGHLLTWKVHLSVSYILPFHTVHGILKARILKCFAIPFSFSEKSPPWPVRLGWPYAAWLIVSLSYTRLWSTWSDWSVFRDCGFQSVCPLLEKDKRLMEASWWERLTEGDLGLVLMVRTMLSRSLIQYSVDGRGCVPSLLFDLRPNYGGGNEDNGDLLEKVPCGHCCAQCPQPCSRPLLTHASARDSWTLTGKSVSVSCGVTAPFFWVLLHTGFLCALQESVSPVLCKFWRLYGGVNGNFL